MRALSVDDEHRQVVVSLEVGARGLYHVEVGEPRGRGPGCLLAHLEAAVDALRTGGDPIPEAAAGLRGRVGEGPDLARAPRPDVLIDQRGRGTPPDRIDRTHVHDIAHRGG